MAVGRAGGAEVDASTGALHRPADEDEQRAEREESEIPPELVGPAADVMDAEDVVVDHAFNQVEQPPADENPTPEHSGGPDAPAGVGDPAVDRSFPATLT